MVPTVYIRMDEMPRNTNGKIDKLPLELSINSWELRFLERILSV